MFVDVIIIVNVSANTFKSNIDVVELGLRII